MSAPGLTAHPFGDPQTLEVARDGADASVVHVTWKVGAADDLTLLGIHLEVLPEDRVMLDGAISYEAEDAGLVAEAPEVADYALDHVVVTAGGSECEGAVASIGDLTSEGADLAFTCAQPVESVSVEVTTLTDLHPAYRTLANGPDGQHAVYGSDSPVHEWTLPAVAGAAGPTTGSEAPEESLGAGASAALQMGGVLGAVLILGVAVSLVVRSRRRRTPASTTLEGERRARTTEPAQAP